MRGTRSISTLACVAVIAVMNSGCAIKNLKEANQRLKESNDRLITENNRLESELAKLDRDLQLAKVGGPVAPAAKPAAPTAVVTSADPGNQILREIGGGDLDISEDKTGVHIRADHKVFFALGQAKLSKGGQGVLAKLGRAIKSEYPGRVVRVEGHTDDVPVRKVRDRYPTNWELSTARACTVVRYLVDQAGVSPRRIYPAGFSYYKPIASGRSTKARSQNRRVEITILHERA